MGLCGHYVIVGTGRRRRRRRCGVIGENGRRERGTSEGRVDLRG